MQQFDHYLSYLLDPYSWSLLSNHFHFQVKMKSEEYAAERILRLPDNDQTISQKLFLAGKKPFHELASKAFSQFFISYSLSYHNQIRVNGNLFYKNFKRVEIENDNQFRNTMTYIHTNPVKHGLIEDFTEYEWSSWHEFTKKKFSAINREEVYEIFGNKQAFLNAHQLHQDLILRNKIFIL